MDSTYPQLDSWSRDGAAKWAPRRIEQHTILEPHILGFVMFVLDPRQPLLIGTESHVPVACRL